MTRVSFRHGTAYAYQEFGCRCDVCKQYNTVRARELRKAKVYGRFESKFVDCQPAREHVQSLLNQGWGFRTIAELSGVGLGQLQKLVNGRSPGEMKQKYPRPQHLTRILKSNAEKLLALHYDVNKTLDGANVPSVSTIRRMQALVAVGYSLNWQAQQIGWQVQNYLTIMKRPQVAATTHRLVKDLFEQYAYTRRTGDTKELKYSINRSLNYAKKHGWVTAMAWDDIENDSAPASVEDVYTVDTVIVETLLSGQHVPVPYGTKRLYAKAMLQYGVTQAFVAETLRMNNAELKRVRGELTNEFA